MKASSIKQEVHLSDDTHFPPQHPKVSYGKTGVLLINLGTPSGTDYWSMRRYLGQFLSDRRVIEVPRLIWYPILHLIILTFRPGKSGKAYAEIWNEHNESPLLTTTRNQAEQLQERMKDKNVHVDFAMRYGKPAIADKLQAMKDAGVDRLLIFPLYPQYSATTTATVMDEVFRKLMAMRWQPTLRSVPPFHDDPAYIDALATSVEKSMAAQNINPDMLVASFHGLPKSYFMKGDPYHCQCQKTGRLLMEKLGRTRDNFMVTFQSRFGPQEWLQPYTDKSVVKLGEEKKSVAVVTPGFVTDCVETLEEISIGVHEEYEEAGGTQFNFLECLNDSEEAMNLYEHICLRELSGWV